MNRIAFLMIFSAIGLLPFGTAVYGEDNDEKGNALRFKMKSLDGKEIDLQKKYLGKVVMVVNVATKCGLTPQYEKLQALHEKYSKVGLAIVGVPCNQFGMQEPGTAKEIASFCKENYGVEFDMMAKVEVNGKNACPLYKHLTSVEAKPAGKGKISWNFEKFVIDRKGNVVARIKPFESPDSPGVIALIKQKLIEKP
ncbi:MAG: glutathione peroxidase [Pirellulaceae bacterium]|nr:glutathione peroxidase [Pirellulaceae bacterium]